MKDKSVEKLIKLEIKRQLETINLIASENFVSDDILEALGSELTNKYSEGYPGKRYYPGNKHYDEIEKLACARALKVFKLKDIDWSVNVQPYSGSPANFAIYSALLGTPMNVDKSAQISVDRNQRKSADIMGMALASGGHLTHGHHVSLTGKFWKPVQYITGDDGWLDYDEIEKLAKKEKPKVIVSGFTAYPRKVDFKRFGEIARCVGAFHVADISHIAGLIAAGLHTSPFPYADVVMTTTHKTLRGPRGAAIFSSKSKVLSSKSSLSEAIDRAVFPGIQGGPHNNVTAAKAVAFFEALKPDFKKYQVQILKNAKTFANELTKLGFNLVTGGTDTHLILINLKRSNLQIGGQEAEKKLEAVGIIANRNTVPGDTSPFKPSGLRFGTPAVTTRGMKEKEMREIAKLIYNCLTEKETSTLRRKVLDLIEGTAQ